MTRMARNYVIGRRLRAPITGRTLWTQDEIDTIRNALLAGMAVEAIVRLVPGRSANAVAVKACRMRKHPNRLELVVRRPDQLRRTYGRIATKADAKAKEGSEKLLRAILRYYRRQQIRGSEETCQGARSAAR
jgi:hypothetical protein